MKLEAEVLSKIFPPKILNPPYNMGQYIHVPFRCTHEGNVYGTVLSPWAAVLVKGLDAPIHEAAIAAVRHLDTSLFAETNGLYTHVTWYEFMQWLTDHSVPMFETLTENQEKVCEECKGECTTTCEECKGKGEVTCDYGHDHDCDDCTGNGNYTCSSCCGLGYEAKGPGVLYADKEVIGSILGIPFNMSIVNQILRHLTPSGSDLCKVTVDSPRDQLLRFRTDIWTVIVCGMYLDTSVSHVWL